MWLYKTYIRSLWTTQQSAMQDLIRAIRTMPDGKCSYASLVSSSGGRRCCTHSLSYSHTGGRCGVRASGHTALLHRTKHQRVHINIISPCNCTISLCRGQGCICRISDWLLGAEWPHEITVLVSLLIFKISSVVWKKI